MLVRAILMSGPGRTDIKSSQMLIVRMTLAKPLLSFSILDNGHKKLFTLTRKLDSARGNKHRNFAMASPDLRYRSADSTTWALLVPRFRHETVADHEVVKDRDLLAEYQERISNPKR